MPLNTKKEQIEKDFLITDQVVGKGKDGNVMLIIERSTKKPFVLKILKVNKLNRDQLVFHQYASSVSDMIVKIKDVYEDPNITDYYLVVMEYMEGGNLLMKIKSKSLNEKDSLLIVNLLAIAIRQIHSLDIVHLDIRPENVLFASADDLKSLKLTDFGNAAINGKDEVDFKLAKKHLTSLYMAPELIESNGSSECYDKSNDIYSLGVVAYMMMTNKMPFYDKYGKHNSSEMRDLIVQGYFNVNILDKLTTFSKNLVLKCMKLNAEKRPTAKQIIDAFK